MAPRVIIGGKPRFVHPDTDCVFLGRITDYDLYVRPASDKHVHPEVYARFSDAPLDFAFGMQFAWGQVLSLTAARRIAEYKGLLPFEPLKVLYYVSEPEDISKLQKELRATEHYAVLAAYAKGDNVAVSAGLDALLNSDELLQRHPDAPLERLREVDMTLFLMGRFLTEDFPPSTFFNVTNEKFRKLGGTPLGNDGY